MLALLSASSLRFSYYSLDFIMCETAFCFSALSGVSRESPMEVRLCSLTYFYHAFFPFFIPN